MGRETMKRLILGLVVIVLFSLTACTEEPEVFQITYALNGGVFTDQANTISEIESGSSMSEPVVSKEDYVFKGWYTDSTYNIPYDFSQPIIGDLQLHAKWDYDAILVEQFNIIAELLETVGSSLSKEGYSFDGWFLDDELTNELNLTEILGEADPVIFAKWVLNEYTVTFYALDEIAYQETYLFGQTITVPSEYSITDYTFEGVYLEDSYTTDVNTGITMPAVTMELK